MARDVKRGRQNTQVWSSRSRVDGDDQKKKKEVTARERAASRSCKWG